MVFADTPLPDALRQIDHAQEEKSIVFMLNDLEELRTTCSLHRKSALEAVQEVCKGFPILITETDRHIFVEYIRPPMHLLPSVTKIQKQIAITDDGYWLKPNMYGITATDVLAMLPRLFVRDNMIYLNGQSIRNIYLNGIPLADSKELDQLASEMIESIRIDEHNNDIHITLHKPKEGGFYGQMQAQAGSKYNGSDETIGGVWYSRFRKTSIYDKVGWENSHQTDKTEQIITATGAEQVYANEITTDNTHFTNRLSLMHEFTQRQSLGFSYYVSSHNGRGKAMRSDRLNFNNFSGKNRHTDHELTLRYHAMLEKVNTDVKVIADIFSRQTNSENASLYGAGVGTEIGETPSIVMTKLAADVQTTISSRLSLLYGFDYRSFTSLYDPRKFLSNLNGVYAFINRMEQKGTLMSGDLGLRLMLGQATLDAEISPQNIESRQKISEDRGTETVSNEYSQFDWNSHLRLFLPCGTERQHAVTLSYRRERDEIPYSAMSPAIHWNDAYNHSTGNASLLAPFSRLLMVNASFWRNRLSASASYECTENEIYWQSVVSNGQTEVIYTSPVNLSSTRRVMMLMEGNMHPTEHWQTKMLMQWTLRPENETIGGRHYGKRHLQQFYNWINHWKLGRQMQLTANAQYQPAYSIYDRTYHATGSITAEVKHSFLGNRLQCGLRVCAWGQNRWLDRKINDYNVSYRYLSPLQHIGVHVAWNFSSRQRVSVSTVEGGQQYKEINDQ